MGLSNEEGNSHLGQMNFVDNQVNPKTGTNRGRAVFDNADGQYTPGLYARLKLGGSAAYAGLLIKDEAVGTDLGKRFVLVIDQDNKAVYRSVDLGPKLEGLRIVRSGLQKEDRIVINGLQRVRPGAVVAPQDAPMADAQTVATLARQRQAIEAGNQPAAPSPALVKTDAAVSPRG
jgi:multidrug efflux system membrane fusion protein